MGEKQADMLCRYICKCKNHVITAIEAPKKLIFNYLTIKTNSVKFELNLLMPDLVCYILNFILWKPPNYCNK